MVYSVSGGMALASGLMAIWYRHSLNAQEAARVAIVPFNGSGDAATAVALIVRF